MQDSARLVFGCFALVQTKTQEVSKSQLIYLISALEGFARALFTIRLILYQHLQQHDSQTPKAGPLYVALQVFWVRADSS